MGDVYLTEEDLSSALMAVPAGVDSTFAREQYVEQWVTNQLLAQEALRVGLRDAPLVRRQLEDNETTVLASAFISALYEDERAAVSAADLEAYYEQHRERLRLREPYLRVRFLETSSADSAAVARDVLQSLARSTGGPREQDSLFAIAARRFAADPSASLALAQSFLPQSRLAGQAAAPWTAVAQLNAGDVSPVLPTADDSFLVVQVAQRVPAGAVPELSWVHEDVERQLLIQNRKRLVAREVQRLRTEAEARGGLRLPPTD